MRVVRIVLAALVLLGLTSAPVTAAGRRTFASELRSIRDHTDGDQVVAISGRVRSQNVRCLGGRDIRVRLDGIDVFYGSGVSDANGNFVVSGFAPAMRSTGSACSSSGSAAPAAARTPWSKSSGSAGSQRGRWP